MFIRECPWGQHLWKGRERCKMGQREKLSFFAVLMEVSVNRQGVLKLRWPCRVVLNWGVRGCVLYPHTSQLLAPFSPNNPCGHWQLRAICWYHSNGWRNKSFSYHTYHNMKYNLRPKELWGCRSVLTPSIKIASHPISYPLDFLQEGIRHQAIVFFKLQEMHIRFFSWDKGKHSHYHNTSRLSPF